MSRYFSKLAKRTGIAPNHAEKVHQLKTHANIRPGMQPNERASLKKGLEANIEKIAEPAGPQRNSTTEGSISQDSRPGLKTFAKKDVIASDSKALPAESEFSVREHDPSHPFQADPVKTNSNDDPVAVFADVPAKAVPAQIPQSEIRQGAVQQSKNMPEGDHQPHAASIGPAAEQNSEPDHALLIEKRQHLREEKTITVQTISPVNENRGASESGDDSFLAMPAARIKALPSTSTAAIGSGEKTPPHKENRNVQIVSERAPTAASQPEKADPPGRDQSVDIRIGTIAFEVHQAPAKKTVTDPPAPGPGPVVKPQKASAQTPRLSRYYLRGI